MAFIRQAQSKGFELAISAISPNIEIGSIYIDFSDLTLVLLIYVGIAFAFSSLQDLKHSKSLSPILIRFHLLVLPSLLWSILFSPLTNYQIYLNAMSIWLTGIISLLILRTRVSALDILKDSNFTLLRLFIAWIISGLFVMPLWVLLERSIFHNTWASSIGGVMIWGFSGFAVTLLYWGGITVLMFIVLLGYLILNKNISYEILSLKGSSSRWKL